MGFPPIEWDGEEQRDESEDRAVREVNPLTSNDTPAAVAGRISAHLSTKPTRRCAPIRLLSVLQRCKTFTLNSREFYEAVRAPAERPWIPNGALPREPRPRDPEVIVERGGAKARR